VLGDEGSPASTSRSGRQFDTGVFAQSELWVDEAGRTFYVDELTLAEYLLLLAWLRRHARHFYLQVLRQEFAGLLMASNPAQLGGPPESVPEALFLSAEEWLEQTPLVVALSHYAGIRKD
jgi:hypothetical protein